MLSTPIDQDVTPGEAAPVGFARRMRVAPPPSVLKVGLIGVLMAALYYRVLEKLVIDWWQIPDNSHGFLVPIFAGYLLWSQSSAISPRLVECSHCHHGEFRSDRGNRIVCPVLGSRQGNGFLSRVLRVGDIFDFFVVPVCHAADAVPDLEGEG